MSEYKSQNGFHHESLSPLRMTFWGLTIGDADANESGKENQDKRDKEIQIKKELHLASLVGRSLVGGTRCLETRALPPSSNVSEAGSSTSQTQSRQLNGTLRMIPPSLPFAARASTSSSDHQCNDRQNHEKFGRFDQGPPRTTHNQGRRPKIKKREFVFHSSRLRISAAKDSSYVDAFTSATSQRPHNYTNENCRSALCRFIQRDLLRIEDCNLESWKDGEGWSCLTHFRVEKLVSVPSQGSDSVIFFGQGRSLDDAEQNCSMRILEELHEFDVVKESAIEFQKNRRDLLNPLRKLDLRLRAYLDLNNVQFFEKTIDRIENDPNNFY